MTTLLMVCMITVAVSGADSTRVADPGDGQPLKYLSSCEIDLNADGVADIAMLVETVRGWEARWPTLWVGLEPRPSNMNGRTSPRRAGTGVMPDGATSIDCQDREDPDLRV